ncbi:MAG: hypothetical protein NTY61_02050 [Candidatus Parcubacteria bacterium]|nr:hypothetical protein [Candidatus Parcubacteria bacterium]
MLSSYYTTDLDNQIKHAGEIIYNAAQRYQINPWVLVTLLQKEQTLVTSPVIKSTQYDFATGFACYDGGGTVSRFSGFTVQIDRAAWRLRYFLEHPWEFTYQAGQIYRINGVKVRLQNLATAALYNYTPHISGNRLFWQIWQNWFAQKGAIPNGTLVQAYNDKGVWLIQNNLRRPFHSLAVFLASYSFGQVRKISKKDLLKYEIGEPMAFSNYSLLKASSGDIFLLVDGIRRKIYSDDLFKEIGFRPEEIVSVDSSDLIQYPEGKPITTPYPSGALLRDKISGLVYYVQDDMRHPIIDEIILYTNFPYDNITDVDPSELNAFNLGDPVKFRDGTLVKGYNNPTVYIISQGKKSPIANAETFEAMGYCWDNIITASNNVLSLHSLGDTLDISRINTNTTNAYTNSTNNF